MLNVGQESIVGDLDSEVVVPVVVSNVFVDSHEFVQIDAVSKFFTRPNMGTITWSFITAAVGLKKRERQIKTGE